MKRNFKKHTGVYGFLDASGLLENGTGKQIEAAKKQYWKDYKKKWYKEHKENSKPFKIVVDLKQAKKIEQQAKKFHLHPATYIKQASLSNNQIIINPATVGEIRELIVLHHNSLLSFLEEDKLPKQIANQLISQVSRLENRILEFLSSFK